MEALTNVRRTLFEVIFMSAKKNLGEITLFQGKTLFDNCSYVILHLFFIMVVCVCLRITVSSCMAFPCDF